MHSLFFKFFFINFLCLQLTKIIGYLCPFICLSKFPVGYFIRLLLQIEYAIKMADEDYHVREYCTSCQKNLT